MLTVERCATFNCTSTYTEPKRLCPISTLQESTETWTIHLILIGASERPIPAGSHIGDLSFNGENLAAINVDTEILIGGATTIEVTPKKKMSELSIGYLFKMVYTGGDISGGDIQYQVAPGEMDTYKNASKLENTGYAGYYFSSKKEFYIYICYIKQRIPSVHYGLPVNVYNPSGIMSIQSIHFDVYNAINGEFVTHLSGGGGFRYKESETPVGRVLDPLSSSGPYKFKNLEINYGAVISNPTWAYVKGQDYTKLKENARNESAWSSLTYGQPYANAEADISTLTATSVVVFKV